MQNNLGVSSLGWVILIGESVMGQEFKPVLYTCIWKPTIASSQKFCILEWQDESFI